MIRPQLAKEGLHCAGGIFDVFNTFLQWIQRGGERKNQKWILEDKWIFDEVTNGSVYALEELKEIAKLVGGNGLPVHRISDLQDQKCLPFKYVCTRYCNSFDSTLTLPVDSFDSTRNDNAFNSTPLHRKISTPLKSILRKAEDRKHQSAMKFGVQSDESCSLDGGTTSPQSLEFFHTKKDKLIFLHGISSKIIEPFSPDGIPSKCTEFSREEIKKTKKYRVSWNMNVKCVSIEPVKRIDKFICSKDKYDYAHDSPIEVTHARDWTDDSPGCWFSQNEILGPETELDMFSGEQLEQENEYVVEDTKENEEEVENIISTDFKEFHRELCEPEPRILDEVQKFDQTHSLLHYQIQNFEASLKKP